VKVCDILLHNQNNIFNQRKTDNLMKTFTPGIIFSTLALFFTIAAPIFSQQWDTLAAVPEDLTFPIAAVVNGKIHVMGGGGSGGATSAHYAYDPVTDTWQSRAAVPYLAQQPAGTVSSGKIHYFGGGYPNSGSPLDDHYVYDPIADSWEQAADLTAPRAIHYAASIETTLYSLAGQGMTNLCQSYSSTTNTWTTLNSLPDNNFWYGAHVTVEGHIYRFCGGGYTAPTNKAHKYDPVSDSWSSLPDMPNAIHALAGAAIGNQIILSGGYFDFIEHDEVWIFDTDTETYTSSVPLPIGRNYHNMVSLDSCVYSIGGNNAIDPTVKTSLIRLCPFDILSSTKEIDPSPSFTANYHFGKLSLRLSEEIKSVAYLSIFDLKGREVWTEKLPPSLNGYYQLNISDLIPSIYVVHLISNEGEFTNKINAY